jgi:hypothetical protein
MAFNNPAVLRFTVEDWVKTFMKNQHRVWLRSLGNYDEVSSPLFKTYMRADVNYYFYQYRYILTRGIGAQFLRERWMEICRMEEILHTLTVW